MCKTYSEKSRVIVQNEYHEPGIKLKQINNFLKLG